MRDPLDDFRRMRTAEQRTVDLNRSRSRVSEKLGRTDARPKNRITDNMGRTVGFTQPGGRVVSTSGRPVAMGSQSSYADRVAASMRDGTFAEKQRVFNEGSKGKQVMDDRGMVTNVTAPKEQAATPAVSTPAATPAPAATKAAKLAPPAPQVPSGAPGVGASAGAAVANAAAQAGQASIKPKGRIFDNGRDVTADIQAGLKGDKSGDFYAKSRPGGAAPSAASPAADPMMAQMQKVQDAAKGISTAQATIDKTQAMMPARPAAPAPNTSKMVMAPAPKPGSAAASAPPAPVNPTPTAQQAKASKIIEGVTGRPAPITASSGGRLPMSLPGADPRSRNYLNASSAPVSANDAKARQADVNLATPGTQKIANAVTGTIDAGDEALRSGIKSAVGGVRGVASKIMSGLGAVNQASANIDSKVNKWLTGDPAAKKRLGMQ